MAGIYRKYLRLLEKWPADPTKQSRDLGKFIRDQIKLAFSAGELSLPANQEQCIKTYETLTKLADNHYYDKYKRTLTSSATGLTPEQCQAVLSDDFLEILKEEDEGFITKVFKRKSLFKGVRWKSQTLRHCHSGVHVPVMCNEVLNYLNIEKGNVLIDMTFGGGGHTKLILQSVPDVTIFCLDRDPIAYEKCLELKKLHPDKIIPCKGKFSDLPSIMTEHGINKNSVDRILFDFGCSSMQFDTAERGFSISNDGPLDMRMDPTIKFTAADVLNNIDEEDLVKIFKIYGEEKHSKKIARSIIEARYSFSPIKTTSDLSNLVSVVLSDLHRTDRLQRPAHSATKVFQALRIFVNNELNEINYGMILASHYLKIGGRLVTLSFHSLEDRIVKRHLISNEKNVFDTLPLKFSSHMSYHCEEDIAEIKDSDWMVLTKHVITPSEDEVTLNPRSRSAKLRAAVKIK